MTAKKVWFSIKNLWIYVVYEVHIFSSSKNLEFKYVRLNVGFLNKHLNFVFYSFDTAAFMYVSTFSDHLHHNNQWHSNALWSVHGPLHALH